MMKCQDNTISNRLMIFELFLILFRNGVRFILLKVFSFLFFFYCQGIVSNELNHPPPPFCFRKITFQLDFIEDEIPAGNQRIKATLLTLYPKNISDLSRHRNRGMKC